MQPHRKKVKRATEPVAITHPHLMAEWDYERNNSMEYDPYKLTYGSRTKVYWLCQENNHSWDIQINNRSKGTGCPYCANRKVCADNCLANNDTRGISQEWDQEKNGTLTPNDVVPMSNKKVWWKCSKNHSWHSNIHSRSSGKGCPYCANQKVCEDNCLANNDPHGICAEWDYDKNGSLSPKDVTSHSHTKVWWICQKGHNWYAIINNRSRGKGCPYCNNESRK